MLRRSLLGVVLAGAALVLLALPAQAGGWASVTLDSLPGEARAGQTMRLGFMVRQHGVTPVSFVQPVLTARHRDSGESIRAPAQQEGAVGHFVVDVTFPAAGAWAWEIIPAPFEGTKFEPLTVLPALSAADESSVEQRARAATSEDRFVSGAALRWMGIALVLAAVGVVVVIRRRELLRRVGRAQRGG